MGEQLNKGSRSDDYIAQKDLLNVHTEYAEKLAPLASYTETPNFSNSNRDVTRLVKEMKNEVLSVVNTHTEHAIQSAIDAKNKSLSDRGLPLLSERQVATIRNSVQKQMESKFKGLTTEQRLTISKNKVAQRVKDEIKLGARSEAKGRQAEKRVLKFMTNTREQTRLAKGSNYRKNERILTSEMGRARQTTQREVIKELGMFGRWVLSSNHHVYDICDELAVATGTIAQQKLQRYQLNIAPEGLYDAKEIPDYPHPYCQCDIEEVYEDIGMSNYTEKQMWEQIGEQYAEQGGIVSDEAKDYYEKWRKAEAKADTNLNTDKMTPSQKQKAVSKVEKLIKANADGSLRPTSATGKAIKEGGFRAYEELAKRLKCPVLDRSVVEAIGSDNAVKLLAADLKSRGLSETAIKALTEYKETTLSKVMSKSLKEAQSSLKKAEQLKGMVLNGTPKRAVARERADLIRKAKTELGDAVGFSDTHSKLLSALQSDSSMVSFKISGKSADSKIATALGLDRKDYYVTKTKHGRGRYMVLNDKSIDRAISNAKDYGGSPLSKKLQDIRKGSSSVIKKGWLPKGMKSTYVNSKTGQTEKLTLKKEQQIGIKFITESKSALLDYSPGVGKTHTALGAIGELKAEGKVGRALVITNDEKLVTQFVDETGRYTTLTASKRGAKGVGYDSGSDITVITPSQFKNDYDRLKKSGYNMVVVDEAHLFDRAKSTDKSYWDMLKDMKGIDYKVAMTGTPIRDKASDMYGMASWLTPDTVPNKTAFKSKFSAYGKMSSVYADSAKKDLASSLDKVLLQADLKTTGKKKVHTVPVKLTSEEKAKVDKIAKTVMSKQSVTKKDRAVMTKNIGTVVNQTENGGKIKAMDALLAKNEGKKVVIHVQDEKAFKNVVEHLGEGAKAVGVPKQTKSERAKAISSFMTDSDTKVLVVNHTVNTGVNLDSADVAIMYDRPNLYSTQFQMEARTHRGTKATDTDQYYLMTDTVYDTDLTTTLAKSQKEAQLVEEASKALSKGYGKGDLTTIFERLLRR